MTTTDRQRLDTLSKLPCAACGNWPVQIHHVINQQHRKRDHQRTIPLCVDCHTGPLSIHRARKSFRAKYGHEENLLTKVNMTLEKD